MIRSSAEIRAEVLKASRGAGLPLGVAEDLAQWAEALGEAELSRLAQMIAEPARHDALISACLDQDLTGQNQLFGSETTAQGARDITEDTWSVLSTLAARTYVPESDASRESGAGAGDIDND